MLAAYELYYYIDDPETLDKVGPVVETVRVYRNGAKTFMTHIDGDVIWSTHTSDDRPMQYGSVTTTPFGVESAHVAEAVKPWRLVTAYIARAARLLTDEDTWLELTRI